MYLIYILTKKTRSSATVEIAHDVDDVKWPLKVTQGHPLLCQSTRHMWPSLHVHKVELEKNRLGVSGRALVSGCPEHWTIKP